jgi:aminopeptidase N
MRTDTGHVFKLEEYRPSAHRILEADLTFRLDPNATQVIATLTIERTPGTGASVPLVLDGDGLTLERIAIDGEDLPSDAYDATPDQLTLAKLPAARRFELLLETVLSPDDNTELMGLYRSSGVYCTQCEAEGFRRIT